MEHKRIRDFTDLFAWKEGHKLVILIFNAINKFPRDVFFLKDQMGRCSVSITSNIAEGFSRKSRKEKIQFYYISLGSITELQNQLIISKDLGYITESKYDTLNKQVVLVQKLTNGLIKSACEIKNT